MVKSTGTGTWWRTAAYPADASCNDRSSTSVKSTTPSVRHGARRSRSSKMDTRQRVPWRSSLRIVPLRSMTTRLSRSGSTRWNYAGPGSGVRAGWRVHSPSSWASTPSGQSAGPQAARGPAGISSHKHFPATVFSIPGANGACTGTGMRHRPWPIFWVQASNWWRFITGMRASISSLNINGRSSTI